MREDVRQRRARPDVREKCRAYDRERYRLEGPKRRDPTYARDYYAKNRDRLCERQRARRKQRTLSDPDFAMREKLRPRLRLAMLAQGVVKAGRASKYGIDWQAIIDHLGPKPSRNHQVDHIRPCASIDLSDPEQIRQCWKPENHRWLHKKLNGFKNDRPEDVFLADLRERPDLIPLWEADYGPLPKL